MKKKKGIVKHNKLLKHEVQHQQGMGETLKLRHRWI